MATGVLTDEEIVDDLIEETRQNRPPPA
jgi:hypothetical protein